MTAGGARNRKKAILKIQEKVKFNTWFLFKKKIFKNIAKICNPKIHNPLKFQEFAIREKSVFF